MLKHVYRIIILTFVFFIALYLFGRNIKEDEVSVNSEVVMDKAKFPVILVHTEDTTFNILHGYSGNLEEKAIRETITPLNEDKTFTILIDENAIVVKKIKYEIYDTDKDEIIDSGSISSLKKTESGKEAKIKVGVDLLIGKEYAVKITTISNRSKKIHYYTRIKELNDSHINEKIQFAMDFHNSILDKDKANDIVKYLETDYTKENKDLAHVDITSNVDSISFGGLTPKVMHDIIPTVNEVNEETASIELSYVMETDKTANKKERYNVKEFYRVRYTDDRMYLLGYDRTMEAIFDLGLTSLAKNEFKIGITSDDEFEIVTNNDATKMSFVRERDLWYYELDTKKAVKVFSFNQDDDDYIRDNYDQHNVKILDITEEGNINFLVYGYMNRGDYEGRVGIILYTFYPEDNRIAEQVYIPLEISYQVLKEDLNNFSYVNEHNVFYFAIDNVVYSYHIPTNALETIVTGVKSDGFLMSKEGKFIAWQNGVKLEEMKEIIILDLETGARKTIHTDDGQNIKMLGHMEDNLIYGYGKSSNIAETTEGTRILPLSKVVIVNKNGEVLKEYEKKTAYILSVKVKDNIIELARVKKSSSAGKTVYQKTSPDYILNNEEIKDTPIYLTERVTDTALLEKYIALPGEYILQEIPSVKNTSNTIITEDTTLRLKQGEAKNNKYYAYALGGIIGSFENAPDAISLADKKMGTVLNSNYQLIWERSKLIRTTMAGIEPVTIGGGIGSQEASVMMMLSYLGVQRNLNEIDTSDKSIYTILEESLKTDLLNLTGCTLEEVLYCISDKRPVIAMKDDNNAVLIIGYDEFNLTYIEPSTGKEVKKGLQDSSDMFENAGNIFISYLD